MTRRQYFDLLLIIYHTKVDEFLILHINNKSILNIFTRSIYAES